VNDPDRSFAELNDTLSRSSELGQQFTLGKLVGDGGRAIGIFARQNGVFVLSCRLFAREDREDLQYWIGNATSTKPRPIVSDSGYDGIGHYIVYNAGIGIAYLGNLLSADDGHQTIAIDANDRADLRRLELKLLLDKGILLSAGFVRQLSVRHQMRSTATAYNTVRALPEQRDTPALCKLPTPA